MFSNFALLFQDLPIDPTNSITPCPSLLFKIMHFHAPLLISNKQKPAKFVLRPLFSLLSVSFWARVPIGFMSGRAQPVGLACPLVAPREQKKRLFRTHKSACFCAYVHFPQRISNLNPDVYITRVATEIVVWTASITQPFT